MKKAVLDTNVLISATFWPGPSYQITVLAIQQKIQCFTSPEILEEYARILERDFHQTKTLCLSRTGIRSRTNRWNAFATKIIN